MFLQHFGLLHAPLGTEHGDLFDDGALAPVIERFNGLLQSPGIGMLTGDPGVGKTATLRHLTRSINPHRYKVIYQPETDFGRVDIYRALAQSLGIEPRFRRAQLWHDLKERITDMVTHQQITPVWIIDEAQNLPTEFFRDFPAFINFAFDSRCMIATWLVGLPSLDQTLDRVPYAALSSRIQVRLRLKPVLERDRFVALIRHGFQVAGCQQTLISDSGIELLRQASKGLPRLVSNILVTAMRLATSKGINHLPDDIINQAIASLR